jgi:hypothetical protein
VARLLSREPRGGSGNRCTAIIGAADAHSHRGAPPDFRDGAAFYTVSGLALEGAAVAAAFLESKPKTAPNARPIEADVALGEAA